MGGGGRGLRVADQEIAPVLTLPVNTAPRPEVFIDMLWVLPPPRVMSTIWKLVPHLVVSSTTVPAVRVLPVQHLPPGPGFAVLTVSHWSRSLRVNKN